MIVNRLRLAAAVALALGVLGSGCRAFDATVDCAQVCTRYRDCFDSNYGVDSCADRCRTNANNDSDFYRDVDTCEACIDDRSCTDATFNCGLQCANVVP